MDIDKLYKLWRFADSLKNGIDPTSGIEFASDTILQLPEIKEYNYEVSRLLMWMLDCKKNNHVISKIPFFLLDQDIERFVYDEEAISISKLCFRMNEKRPAHVEKLHASEVTIGLVKLGYLEEKDTFSGRTKSPTKLGVEMGIRTIEKKNKFNNSYNVNLYNANAQRFIVNNIITILRSSRKET